MKNKILRILLSLLLLTSLVTKFQKSQFSVFADDFVPGQCLWFTGGLNPPSVLDATFTASGFQIYQERDGKKCYYPPSCIQSGSDVNITIENLTWNDPKNDSSIIPEKVRFTLRKMVGDRAVATSSEATADIINNTASASLMIDEEEGRYLVGVSYRKIIYNQSILCDIKQSAPFIVSNSCNPNSCSSEPTDAEGTEFDLCLTQISSSNTNAFSRCITCFNSGGIWTAIGCIPSSSEGIIYTIMRIGLILGGGIVLVMILVGAFMLSTSKGDPKKTQDAKEIITSAIVGLLFIIFSVTILQFIGVSVIKIPGFGQP